MSKWIQALAACVVLCGGTAMAQDYPTRAITLVVNSAAGGPIDAVARVMQDDMAAALGQPIVVENRLGAGGIVGTDNVARAEPDGYTLLLSGTGPVLIAPLLYDDIPYDPLEDFEHVNLSTYLPGAFAIHSGLPATTLEEFIALARAEPGRYSYASSGIGTPSHLAGEMLNLLAGIDLRHIPFRGAPEGIAAVMAGEVSLYPAGGTATLLPLGESGQLHLLAHTGVNPLPAAPDLPSTADIGMPDLTVPSWIGIFAPRGTPAEIVDLLDRTALETLAKPEIQERLVAIGIEVLAEDAAAHAARHREDLEQWRELIDQMGIEVE